MHVLAEVGFCYLLPFWKWFWSVGFTEWTKSLHILKKWKSRSQHLWNVTGESAGNIWLQVILYTLPNFIFIWILLIKSERNASCSYQHVNRLLHLSFKTLTKIILILCRFLTLADMATMAAYCIFSDLTKIFKSTTSLGVTFCNIGITLAVVKLNYPNI